MNWYAICLALVGLFALPVKTKSFGRLDERAPNKRETKDQVTSGTGYAPHGPPHGPPHGEGKHFMYAHQPDKKQYEFGYKRGNDHHTIERYEKAGPEHNFKTKVRWHDSKGGHGEHFYDYNHAPKHDDHHGGKGDHGHHGGGGGGHGHDHGGYHSEPVAKYAEFDNKPSYSETDQKVYKTDAIRNKNFHKRSGLQTKAEEPTSESPSAFPSLLGYDPYEPPAIAKGSSSNPSKYGLKRSYPKKASSFPSKKDKSSKKKQTAPKLAYDLDTGRVFDESSQKWFKLTPV